MNCNPTPRKNAGLKIHSKFVFGPLKEKNNVVAIHFVLHKKNIKKISLRSAKAVGRPVLQAGPGAAGQHRPRDRGGGQAHYW